MTHAGGLFVLTLEGQEITAITRFGDTGVLPYFGLPRTLPDERYSTSPIRSARRTASARLRTLSLR